ncbi:cation diffusion facilitator family transporter [Colletotrichum graminicola]|uniref:Cation diffusion facilitator family transporter n=1 Tax=Colletotrichum graminicola (strain M1.001 / M2 / FGSC 10212) TaxID=645133 RepID=E3QJK2_COLGM|nr:cation diffusion facilitator family transporter [Colletotrichum graminicola M1.001]EFQ31040.1 cation diffusion facilitator family transporter [Colletotrichum graminicola M1.001]WDK17231.1 cation diffusion facilitator family transporter [Colletotrichum graminicola]
MTFHITRKQRLTATIAISGAFCIAELVIGFRTKSLALIADAFHYMNDLIGFVVALLAVIVSERATSPRTLTFGWKRAQILGAFFNGVFLLSLGVSILLQAVERFINITHVKDPVLILIMGCIGLGLNVLVICFLDENDDSNDGGYESDQGEGESIKESVAVACTFPVNSEQANTDSKEAKAENHQVGRDLGMLGVMIHVIGDAMNNVGIIVAAVVVWKGNGDGRFYVDPGVSLFIASTIIASALPLCGRAGHILMESTPPHVDLDDIRAKIIKMPGVESVPELLVWRIDQKTMLATAHVVVADDSISSFNPKATAIGAVLRPYGIHSIALQPVPRLHKGTVTPDAAGCDDPK